MFLLQGQFSQEIFNAIFDELSTANLVMLGLQFDCSVTVGIGSPKTTKHSHDWLPCRTRSLED